MSKMKYDLMEVKVKPLSKITRRDEGPGLIPAMEEYCGTTIKIDKASLQNEYVTQVAPDGEAWDWMPKWLVFPKGFKPPKTKEFNNGELINGHTVLIGAGIKVGCTPITHAQEKKWFKILAKRLGYTLEG